MHYPRSSERLVNGLPGAVGVADKPVPPIITGPSSISRDRISQEYDLPFDTLASKSTPFDTAEPTTVLISVQSNSTVPGLPDL